uniref:Basigin n=1 Tax=Mesocestoides corti TaxID=53468 RepID=A0A5K3EJS0_MESCO
MVWLSTSVPLFFLLMIIGCESYNLRITVLDMDGNEKSLPDVAIRVAASVSFICRGNNVKKNELIWKKASFNSQDYLAVQQSKLVVIDSADGESKLTLTETSFDKAGIYQCQTSLYSARINLHVYGIVDSGGTDVKSTQMTKDFHRISITYNVPDLSTNPSAFCKFQVGQNGVNFATVRWYGEGLKLYRNLFQISESKDSFTGIIYSNLTMRISSKSVRQELFGPYECSFNILPGSSVKQEVFFRITPILVLRPSAETVYEGNAYNLTCEIIAYPRAQTGDITWQRNNQPLWVEDPLTGRLAASPTYDPEGRVHLLSVHSHHDTLSFSHLEAVDRAVYVCSVKTTVGNNSCGVFVRVKSAKSTFWPLLGIGVELIVLTAFILIYERKRRIVKFKPEPPAFNDRQAAGPPKAALRDSGVRQR